MTFIAKTPRWLPLAVVALVLYSALTLVLQWRRHHATPPAPGSATAALDTIPTDSLVARALGPIRETPEDSTVIKTGWRDEVPGIDLAAFRPDQRELFLRCANAQKCTCGCGFTLAACRTFDTTCPVSGPRVESLRDSVRKGLVRSARGLRQRPATAGS